MKRIEVNDWSGIRALEENLYFCLTKEHVVRFRSIWLDYAAFLYQ